MLLFLTGCSFKDLFVQENEKIEYLEGKVNVEITVQDYGVIKLELDVIRLQLRLLILLIWLMRAFTMVNFPSNCLWLYDSRGRS